MINIFSTDIEIMTQEAIISYPLECCGLLLGKVKDNQKQVVTVIPTENDWENQKDLFVELNAKYDGAEPGMHGSEALLQADRQCRDSYSINPLIILQVQKQARKDNLDIIGIYHSHPDHPAIPSAFDTKFAWSMYSYIILSVTKGKVKTIRSWILNKPSQFIEENLQIIDILI